MHQIYDALTHLLELAFAPMVPTRMERRSSPPPRLAQTKHGLRQATIDRGLDEMRAAEDGIGAGGGLCVVPK